MREYFENEIKIIEYSYEDWEQGIIWGNWQSGKTPVEDSVTKTIYYVYFPNHEFERIVRRQKTIYDRDVQHQFEKLKTAFEGQYNRSSNKDRRLANEILNYERLLFPEKLKLRSLNNFEKPIPDLPFTSITVASIRTIYQKAIVRGERDYHLIPSPSAPGRSGYTGSMHTLVESLSLYLDWLREFQELKILTKEELFRKIIAGLGSITIVGGDSQILDQIDSNLLDSYLSTYYRLAAKVQAANTIGDAITNLRALVLYYNEQARRPKVTDISKRDETGKMNFGWIARDTKIDDWINTKIVVPVEDKIKRLEELKVVYTNDTLGFESATEYTKQIPKGFEIYLAEKAKSFLPYLTETYWKAKPQVIAFMLFALDKMNCLKSGTLTNNKKQLHLSLTETFGDIGTRQSLDRNLRILQTPDQYQKNQISVLKNELQKAIKAV